MSLQEQERDTLVNLYLSKCDETLNDARLTRDQGRWNASANRLYYALFHAITALFVRWNTSPFPQRAENQIW